MVPPRFTSLQPESPKAWLPRLALWDISNYYTPLWARQMPPDSVQVVASAYSLDTMDENNRRAFHGQPTGTLQTVIGELWNLGRSGG